MTRHSPSPPPPPPERAPSPSDRGGSPRAGGRAATRRAALLGLGGFGLLVQAACRSSGSGGSPAGAAAARPAVSAAPTPAVTAAEPRPASRSASGTGADTGAAARSGVQAVLDRQAAARNALDRAAYAATIDQRNLVWRRIQSDYFAVLAAAGRQPPIAYRLTRLETKQDGYVKAWIDETPAGRGTVMAQAVWVFRPADTGWLHTEILNEEIGPRKTLDTAHFRLSYFAWDDDIVDRTAAVAERAHARVAEVLGPTPAFLTVLSVNPTFGSHSGLRQYGIWAAYLADAKDTIVSRSMESFGAGMVAPGETQDDRLSVALTHELTHLVNDQIVPVVKMPPWMSEGLAEYVAANLRPDVVGAAVRAGRQFSLDKVDDVLAWGRDPARGYTQRDVVLADGEAAYAVTYFVERFGQPAFFDLARAFAETRRWEDSIRQVTGTTAAEFEAAWLDWLRRTLGA